jgi:uncharacterized protein DUF4032
VYGRRQVAFAHGSITVDDPPVTRQLPAGAVHPDRLDVQEKQARRLLADIASYRAGLERVEEGAVSGTAAAIRWLTELHQPTIAAIPAHLRSRLDVTDTFHEILEHRWFLS